MADFTAGSVLTAAQLDTAFNTYVERAVVTTTATIGAADAGGLLSVNNDSGGTVTIPLNSTWAAETGTYIPVLNAGTAGTWTIGTAVGVTLEGTTTTLSPGSALGLLKRGTNTWRSVPFSSGSASTAVVSGTTGSPATGTGKDGRALYTWTGNGSITFSTAGTIRVLVVGGGRGGASASLAGGGGHVIDLGEMSVAAAAYTVTVGAGGTYGSDNAGASLFSRRGVNLTGYGTSAQNTGDNGYSADATGVLTDISGSSVGYGGAGRSSANSGTYDSIYGGAAAAALARANSGGGGNEFGSGNAAAGIVIVLV